MWWHLDPNDPLDRMILQELRGDPVLFDQFLDAMDELDEEPDCEQILQERGLQWEDVLREAEAYREDFLARLAARGLPINDRFEMCRLLCEQAQAEPSMELLRILCEILCTPGFLLDTVPEIAQEDQEEQREHEEQVIWQYLGFLPDRDELLKILSQRREMAGRFAEVKKIKRSPKSADCATERKYEILQCFVASFDMPDKGNSDILLGNLEAFIQTAAASPVLKSVEPLLLFRLLTRHQSYMCSTPDLSGNLASLWKRSGGSVDRDDGRNFARYRKHLQLFENLCKIYEKDPLVDVPLCWYGLDQLTVLGDFYRQNIFSIIDSSTELPFPPTVEDLVEDALFSCFENGSGDNLMETESGLSYKAIQNFRSSTDRRICAAQDRISDYMNDHAAELTEQFLQAGPAEVRALCRSVLENAKLRSAVPAEELPLFLAAINRALMELQDYYASQYLIQAGQALTETPAPIG